ncbi:proton channel OTOP1 [Paramormyrops kingsleyae]|uniref:Otopetrin 1 n=1 Tax=Paramormyrops kingsleyae TaxID=1676925 RepID=A0A3B3RKP6_9TELE|nr:otopetrin-1 [Paramormyrops kingsleyae]
MVEHNGMDITSLNKYTSDPAVHPGPAKVKDVFIKGWSDYPERTSRVLSAQYGLNLFIMGSSLMLAFSHEGTPIHEEHVMVFMSGVMIIQILWMLWYALKRVTVQRGVEQDIDVHAGPWYIRAGLTVLALLSLCLDILRVGYYVGHRVCLDTRFGLFAFVKFFHTASQIYFLWFHVCDVVMGLETFERFGVMHAIFTNLIVWGNGVMVESDHYLDLALAFVNFTVDAHAPDCNCSSGICIAYTKSVYYLYPFNVEYHVIVSAILFCMWMNIGQVLIHQTPRGTTKVKPVAVIIGPVLGMLAICSTIAVLVIYLSKMGGNTETRDWAISVFYIYGIVMLFSMSVASIVGLLLYRMDHSPLDNLQITPRGLDAQLLFATSMGAWLLSWCSIVAVLANPTYESYRWTNFTYSLLMVLQKYVQNLFIIEALYRSAGEGATEPPSQVFSVTTPDASQNGAVNPAFEQQEADASPDPNIPTGPNPERPSPDFLRVKQEALKNVSIFLLLCNVSLWLIPAFGCRPQYDNELEQETFGFEMWTTLVNIAMPVNLFYRMHSVGALFDVYIRV